MLSRAEVVLAIFLQSLLSQGLAQTKFQTHIQSIYTRCYAKVNQKSAIQVTKKLINYKTRTKKRQGYVKTT